MPAGSPWPWPWKLWRDARPWCWVPLQAALEHVAVRLVAFNDQYPHRRSLPSVVLPSDTAHPDTMPAYRERMEDLKRRVSEWHGFVGAMVVFGDRKVLLSYYAPSATVRIADTTLTGAQQIANGLVDLGRRTSIREFLRAPYRVHATDSVAVDSGAYLIIS